MIRRIQIFDYRYMRLFDQIHEKEVGGKAPRLGFPDMGNGKFSQDLTYSDWFNFNNWQRVHYNFLEHLCPILLWLFISSLYQPIATAILGFLYGFGRILYSIGYCKSPN